MKTICQEKAWEEDGQIKCEFAGWVLTYPKNEVLRIIKTKTVKQAAPPEENRRVHQIITKESDKKKSARQEQTGLPSIIPEDPINIGQEKIQNTKAIKKPSRPSLNNMDVHLNGFRPTWGTPMILNKFIKILVIRLPTRKQLSSSLLPPNPPALFSIIPGDLFHIGQAKP